uniref:Enoyl reductase (ER) domain-containing protein n=1 Tax=Globisporangium ultimum (strain ATCC 200006 / CBS 805.95 / DAOM BR144) TaxID=431595 RepID=K3WQT6_GLOUD
MPASTPPKTSLVFRHGQRTSHHNLKLATEPTPTIDAHQVLVKIRAVALNYRDIGIANSTYPFPIKDDVVPFHVGDRVIANFDVNHFYGPQPDYLHRLGGPIDGVLREYVALPATALFPADCKLSFPQMASLVCTGTTVWNALYGNMPLKPGHTVLFQGTGGVSITGLMFAKAAGATTILTSSSDEKLRMVQTKFGGADHTINYKTTPDWAAEVLKITDGRGVDFILENGGSGTIKQSIDAITPGGVIAVIGFLAQAAQEDMPDVATLALVKQCVVRGIAVGSKQLLEDLVRFVVNKDLQPPVDKTFGFGYDDVLAAFDYVKQGNHVGKVCIELGN